MHHRAFINPWWIYSLFFLLVLFSFITDVKINTHILYHNKVLEIPVQLPRSLSNCWDPVWSKINPLPLLQLHSDHPLILRHYTNHNPKLWVPPNPLTHFLLLSELQMTSENPNHISVFICLHHSVLVLLNFEFIFMSSSQFSPFCFRYIKLFQYSHSLVLASALPSYISTSLLLNSSNSL